MEIKYEITPADLVNYSKEAGKKTSSYTVQVLIFSGVYFLFVLSDVILSFFLTVTPTTSFGMNLLTRSVTGLVLLCVTIAVLGLISKRSAARLMAGSGPNGVFCEHTFLVDENGFTETTHVNKNFGVWAGVESVDVTDNFVAIKVRLCCNYFIPKRAFANREEMLTFVRTVKNYISPGSGDVPPNPRSLDY